MSVFDNAEQILEQEGQYITVLHGNSMWPMIRSRKDPVLICSFKHLAINTARRGDVVAYRMSDRYVVHRVLEVHEECYVIRGDNCMALEYVPHADVIGVMTQWWRDGKMHSVTDSGYRRYVRLWLCCHPLYRLLKRLRWFSLTMLRKIYGILRSIVKK